MALSSSLASRKSREWLLTPSLKEVGDWDLDSDDEGNAGCCRRIGRAVDGLWRKVVALAVTGWEFGRADPRKMVFAAKMSLALTLISILVFHKAFKDLSRYSVWALLTVVVIFEFSIGATLSKGLNRGLGTLSAGGLALGVAELSAMVGDWEEVAIIISIFVVGFCATFVKLYPTMKPYEYGFRVFLLTFCFIMVSGYRTREFIGTAVSRFLLIALGAGVGLGVNICIYPIWAGEDLHALIVKNFMGVAVSLEGCVNGYLQCLAYDRVPSKILTYQASDDLLYSGYRSALQSTSQEDTLLGFAIWEPPHGPYRMLNYPWKNYTKVGGALRHCAFMVMALHGCMLSEIQAPPERRQVFSSELQRVGTEGAKVLRDLGNRVKTMTKLSPTTDILSEVHDAAEELQKKIDRRSYLLVNSESWEIGRRPEGIPDISDGLEIIEDKNNPLGIKSHSETVLDLRSVSLSTSWDAGHSFPVDVNASVTTVGSNGNAFRKQTSWPRRLYSIEAVPSAAELKTYESASALSLATFASLLIEFVARLQNLVDEFEELSEKAKFKEPIVEPLPEARGWWTRISTCFGWRSRT